MNLILLGGTETRQSFAAGTPQAAHLLGVLKAVPGATFWCGAENGPRGLATVEKISARGDVEFCVEWEKIPPPALPPLCLLVGMSRPQTMKKIFASASELGCAEIRVFVSERGDPAYAQSSLWSDGFPEIRAILRKSAEQTCTTHLPEIRVFKTLSDALELADAGDCGKIFLDVYATDSFPKILRGKSPCFRALALAIGSERGWTDAEREILRAGGFASAHMGGRVLRTENAVSAALALALANVGAWEKPHIALEKNSNSHE